SLVRCQLLLPTGGEHHDALRNLLHVRKKLCTRQRHSRGYARWAERRGVGFVDEITGLLEFDGKEECRRDVDALHLSALNICAADVNVVGPKSKARGVGLAVEEVAIVLADIEVSTVDGICAGTRSWRRVQQNRDGPGSGIVNKNRTKVRR